jgi:hypothetical protein
MQTLHQVGRLAPQAKDNGVGLEAVGYFDASKLFKFQRCHGSCVNPAGRREGNDARTPPSSAPGNCRVPERGWTWGNL